MNGTKEHALLVLVPAVLRGLPWLLWGLLIVVIALLVLYYSVMSTLRSSIKEANPPEEPGFLIANGSGREILQLEVSYDSRFVTTSLMPGETVTMRPVNWGFEGSGDIKIALKITFREGDTHERLVETFARADTFLQIAIDDQARIHLR